MMRRPIWLLGIFFLASAVCGQDADVPRAVSLDSLDFDVENDEPGDATAGDAVEAPPPALVFGDRVLSRSGQFRVSGGEPALRGSFAILAEEVRDHLQRLLGENDEDWSVPVSILLAGSPDDLAPERSILTSLFHGETGHDLRLHVHIGRGMDMARFEHAVLAALLYERGLRGMPPGPVDSPLIVPPWLVAGLREANAWRLGGGDRRLYEALFRTGGLFGLDDLFAVNDAGHDSLDAASRAAFHVSSGALVMALLEQPDGIEGFRKFLDEVAAFDGEKPALLRRHFPDLNLSESSLAKWWALQLANKGAARLTESLSIAETEAALGEALVLRFRDIEDSGLQELPVEQWQALDEIEDAERIAAVRMAEDALVRLSYRCFPSYRPLLMEYQDALARIARNERTDSLDAQLADLAAARATMMARGERARDYLDWFEITRARETSGAFDDYLRLKERLAARESTRKDQVTEVLDRFDRIFHRDQPAPSQFRAPAFDGWSAYPNLPTR